MQDATTYSLRKITRRNAKGSTLAVPCSINALLKFDGPEAPHCVYSETVALRLAQTLHIPVADGVVVSTGSGEAYASLEVASPGMDLPDVLRSQRRKVAKQYPESSSALVAFDLWIGNWDRESNMKASLVTPHIPLFRAFDHSHALLNVDGSVTRSIQRLRSGELIVQNHPLYGLVKRKSVDAWMTRITSMPRAYIDECCRFGRAFRNVNEHTQARLSNALDERRSMLSAMLRKHARVIFATP